LATEVLIIYKYLWKYLRYHLKNEDLLKFVPMPGALKSNLNLKQHHIFLCVHLLWDAQRWSDGIGMPMKHVCFDMLPLPCDLLINM